MFSIRNLRILACLLALLLGAYGPAPARATTVTYQVILDTSSVNGTNGGLLFQFTPGNIPLAATATVTGFQSDGGVPAPSALYEGSASGLLPGALTLTNNTALNYVYQDFTFGNNLVFDVTLSGPAVGSPADDSASPNEVSAGSSFVLSLLDLDGGNLLTTDPNGGVVNLNLDADGAVRVLTFPTPGGGPPVASVIAVVSPVPEPGSLLLMATIIPAGLVLARRVGRSAAFRPVGKSEGGGGMGTCRIISK